MYRQLTVKAVVADDSNLSNATTRECTVYQTRDLEGGGLPTIRLAPGDSEATITLGNITTAYFCQVFSDYPVMVRFNGAAETQFTLTPANVQPVNVGGALPPQCTFGGTVQVTELRLEPIAAASQTANCWVILSGDPLVAY